MLSEVRRTIREHDCEAVDPAELQRMQAAVAQEQKNAELDDVDVMMVSYVKLLAYSSAFLAARPCLMSRTALGVADVLYFVTHDSGEDTISLSTLYVHLAMALCRKSALHAHGRFEEALAVYIVRRAHALALGRGARGTR